MPSRLGRRSGRDRACEEDRWRPPEKARAPRSQPPAARGRARTDPMAEPFGARGLARKYASNRRAAIRKSEAGHASLASQGERPRTEAAYFFSPCSNCVARSRYSVAARISLARVSSPMSLARLMQCSAFTRRAAALSSSGSSSDIWGNINSAPSGSTPFYVLAPPGSSLSGQVLGHSSQEGNNCVRRLQADSA